MLFNTTIINLKTNHEIFLTSFNHKVTWVFKLFLIKCAPDFVVITYTLKLHIRKSVLNNQILS